MPTPALLKPEISFMSRCNVFLAMGRAKDLDADALICIGCPPPGRARVE